MKVVCLLSGGIDSPVAAAMLMKKHEVVLLHIDNSPLSPKIVKKKAMELAKVLKRLYKKELILYVVPHGGNLKEFAKNEKRMTCILCRRMMYRIANEIAKKEGAEAIATGESLAQVASQTLPNLATESKASRLPILRPLIGLDKTEIIERAKKLKTYEISIKKEIACHSMKGRSMCCYATPQYPRTRSDPEELESMERGMPIRRLLDASVKSAEKIVL